jgi:hypothetical protein
MCNLCLAAPFSVWSWNFWNVFLYSWSVSYSGHFGSIYYMCQMSGMWCSVCVIWVCRRSSTRFQLRTWADGVKLAFSGTWNGSVFGEKLNSAALRQRVWRSGIYKKYLSIVFCRPGVVGSMFLTFIFMLCVLCTLSRRVWWLTVFIVSILQLTILFRFCFYGVPAAAFCSKVVQWGEDCL